VFVTVMTPTMVPAAPWDGPADAAIRSQAEVAAVLGVVVVAGAIEVVVAEGWTVVDVVEVDVVEVEVEVEAEVVVAGRCVVTAAR
jgi:hypothetical protein